MRFEVAHNRGGGMANERRMDDRLVGTQLQGMGWWFERVSSGNLSTRRRCGVRGMGLDGELD